MALDKAGLIQAAIPKVEEVEINGDVVLVSEISQEAYESIVACTENKNADGEQNWYRTMTALIVASVVNPDRSKMFTPDESSIVAGFSRDIRKKLTDASVKANGFGDDEKKPSEPTTEGSDNGESQLLLGIDTL